MTKQDWGISLHARPDIEMEI